jgi:hypothetical protein
MHFDIGVPAPISTLPGSVSASCPGVGSEPIVPVQQMPEQPWGWHAEGVANGSGDSLFIVSFSCVKSEW